MQHPVCRVHRRDAGTAFVDRAVASLQGVKLK